MTNSTTNLPILDDDAVGEIEALSAKVPDGPWFAAADDAEDVPDHRCSGLALVDTGRSADWWIARLCEWHVARFIAESKTNIDALCATVRALRAENERALGLFKNACRLHTSWTIDRYLMSNAVNRLDPAEKAQRHIELCQFYVAAVHGCSPEDAMSDYEQDFDRLHEESQELTSSLDAEIGFPLDQTPDYDELNPKFFERFHAIACRVLGTGATQMTLEQKQQIEQIRERRAKEYGHSFTGTVGTDAAMRDIDFLLSLVKSQEAPLTEWESHRDGIIELVTTAENAATSMRSACVMVAKDFQRMDRDDFYRKYKTSMLITALESVSIQEQEK